MHRRTWRIWCTKQIIPYCGERVLYFLSGWSASIYDILSCCCQSVINQLVNHIQIHLPLFRLHKGLTKKNFIIVYHFMGRVNFHQLRNCSFALPHQKNVTVKHINHNVKFHWLGFRLIILFCNQTYLICDATWNMFDDVLLFDIVRCLLFCVLDRVIHFDYGCAGFLFMCDIFGIPKIWCSRSIIFVNWVVNRVSK